jgi:uncharacterized protein
MQPSKGRSEVSTVLFSRVYQIIDHVRCTPLTRSIVYLSGAALTMELVWRVFRPIGPYALVRLHLANMPFLAVWTYACTLLRPEDRAHWHQVPVSRGIRQLLVGAGLGIGAFFTWVGAAGLQGWVAAPTWGWEQASGWAVIQAIFLHAVGHLAVAWNEEMICRGYGFDTMRAAIGLWGAAGVVTVLYVVSHGLNSQTLLGQTALGIVLLLLRLQSGSLWLPVGYHWAWNYIQTGVLGAPDAEPSLRPLRIQGPYMWTGRPGYPEPGLLSTLVHFLVALLVLVWMWRAASQRDRETVQGTSSV